MTKKGTHSTAAPRGEFCKVARDTAWTSTQNRLYSANLCRNRPSNCGSLANSRNFSICSDFCSNVSKTTSVESQSKANRSRTASTRSNCLRASSKTRSGAGASGKNWGVIAVSCTEKEADRASRRAVAIAEAAFVAAFKASSTPSSAPSWRDSSVFGSGRGSRPAREHRGQTRSERPQNRRSDHPRHRAMATSRATLQGTPRARRPSSRSRCRSRPSRTRSRLH
jgi:hypothetical protein